MNFLSHLVEYFNNCFLFAPYFLFIKIENIQKRYQLRRCLVIDEDFRPIKIISWEKAIIYLINQKAEIIEEYHDFIVRSVSLALKVPKILKVFGKSRIFHRRVSLTNRNIQLRDGYTCAYCEKKFKEDVLTVDHIIPLCQGGPKRNWLNMITACQKCNYKKAGRTPDQANMPLKFKPTIPKWSPKHFLGAQPMELIHWKDWF